MIERTLTYADVAGSGSTFSSFLFAAHRVSTDLHTTLPLLAPAILKQFESKAGYILADDALPLLQSLKQVSTPPLLGLCSNSDRRIMGPLRDLGVFEFIAQENLLTSWDIESSKPDPLIFRAAVELLGKDQVKPQDCLFVGDDYAE